MRRHFIRSLLGTLIGASFIASNASAYLENQKLPGCYDGPTEKQVNNAEILHWKTSTRNQFLARGYASGVVQGKPWIKGEHLRFIMKIGPNPQDGLEVIYNLSFGRVPDIKDGEPVVVCGDYITSNAKAGGYEPSPVGAIIHWVHYNPGNRPSSKQHEHGFVAFGSTLVGFDEAPLGAWNGKIGGKVYPPLRDKAPETKPNPRPTAKPTSRPKSQPYERRRKPLPAPAEENLPEICKYVRGRCR